MTHPSRSERAARVQDSRTPTVPWSVHVRAWQVYAALGHGDQSAQRIHERGGFGQGELIRFLAERDPFSKSGWEPLSERQQMRLSRYRREQTEAL